MVAKGLVSISKIGGTDNIADIGTKAVSREVLVRLRPQVGIVEMGSVRSQVDALAATCSGTADGAAHLSYQRLPEAAAAIGANWNTILAGLVLMQQAFQARGDAATSAAEATSMQHVSVLVQSSKIEWWLITFLLLAVTWMLLKPSPSSGNCWRHLFGFVAPSSCNQSILKIDVGVQTLPLEEKTAVVVEERLVDIEKIVNVEVLPPEIYYTEVGDCAHTDKMCRTILNSRKKKPLRPCKACTRRGGRGETRLRAHPGRSTIPKDDERWQHVAGQTSEKIPIRAKDAKMGIEKMTSLQHQKWKMQKSAGDENKFHI